jgi:hypothetical protein
MRIVKNLALIALILASFSLVPQTATAGTSVAVGFSTFHHGYHSYYPYYRPFFYGYPYWGGFYPYYGLGYGGYGYGYGGYGGYGYRPYGEVRTEVKPQSAQVFVDGGLVGKADDYDGWWQRLNLSPGMHRIVFRAPGFQPYVTDIRIGIGTDFHLKYEMHPGNDNIAEQEMMLPHSKQYSRRGYDRHYGNHPQYDPYQRPDNHRDQQYERRPPQDDRDNNYDNDQDQYQDQDHYQDQNQDRNNDDSYYGDQQHEGRQSDRRPLILHIEPDDATVYIDGNYYGTANDNGNDLQVLLPEGAHRIEVVRPGFDSFSQQVTIARDRDNHVNVILKKK